MLFQEYRGFGNTPASVDLNKVVPPTENHGQWVRIDQTLLVHCQLSAQEQRQPPDSWFFGRIENTFFIASIAGSNRNLLLVYDGDVNCEDAKNQTIVGVLEELNSRRRSYLGGGGFVFPPGTDMQLSVGDGPESYRRLMMWGMFLPLVSIFCIVWFWPKWRAQVRRSEDLTSNLTAPYTPKAF